MAEVTVGLDAELVVEVMVLAGVKSPQDAVEPAVRDFVAHGHRTEARTATPEEVRARADRDAHGPQDHRYGS
ncbi:type II toxin-antitoxin system VapB family antitoxin [Streptomyces sp. NPDC058373]|uniref:type II toxin-antitoxin system VapB family antitoxin n=1 Tax=Streptomyces sp. NPDC058373 TaxID=3346465 RepID=UPI00364602B9